jgi:SM-20-related protein
MPSPNFFAPLGFFVIREFLEAQLCAKFRSEIRSVIHTPMRVVEGDTFQEKVKESVRSTKHAEISAVPVSEVADRLLAMKPRLENHFDLALAGCEKPEFLVYNEGDFFLPHRDGDDNPSKPEYIKKRRVSAVIFLNHDAQETEAESYRGGALTFYGLIDDPPWGQCGFPLVSEVGLLIAFRSDIYHEVTPVTRGERYTIASWFF